jgi:hypothetical protein
MLDEANELALFSNGAIAGPVLTSELLTGLRDGVAVLDRMFRVVAWNGKLEKWTGLKGRCNRTDARKHRLVVCR